MACVVIGTQLENKHYAATLSLPPNPGGGGSSGEEKSKSNCYFVNRYLTEAPYLLTLQNSKVISEENLAVFVQ